MKLLFITQKMDMHDDVLGFVHRWVEEFSKKVERVEVICLYEGEHQLPENVQVHSLGKERAVNFELRITKRIKYTWRFLRHIVRKRNSYDAVFVHMNQMYVLLGAPFWMLMGKKVFLWYAHGHTPFTLRIAALFSRSIFTSTASGCRLRSGKIRVVGQGIDTDYFRPREVTSASRSRLIMVGRLSPVKDHPTLLKAASRIKNAMPLSLSIVGAAGVPEQVAYERSLKTMITSLGLEGVVTMHGKVEYRNMLPYLHASDMFINTSLTGSLDKAGLEAMAAAMPVVTCNEAYKAVLGKYLPLLFFEKGDYEGLSRAILTLYALPPSEWSALRQDMREIVVRCHGVERFAEKITSIMMQP
ncbi:MAG TPA: glycosyltransferase family 4 protein [Candidatus Paceibacterota bacterium]